MAKKKSPANLRLAINYSDLLGDVVSLLEAARRTSARTVNAVMTATYWEVGRRIVEVEQRGSAQADYGDELMKRLAADLTIRFGRGFGWRNLYRMRNFHLTYCEILPTPSAKSGGPTGHSVRPDRTANLPTVSAKSQTDKGMEDWKIEKLAQRFPLPWSHYDKLLGVDANARQFYEVEALRGGWSVRQLDRQINSQFYERTLLSKNKSAMLRKAEMPLPEDLGTPDIRPIEIPIPLIESARPARVPIVDVCSSKPWRSSCCVSRANLANEG